MEKTIVHESYGYLRPAVLKERKCAVALAGGSLLIAPTDDDGLFEENAEVWKVACGPFDAHFLQEVNKALGTDFQPHHFSKEF